MQGASEPILLAAECSGLPGFDSLLAELGRRLALTQRAVVFAMRDVALTRRQGVRLPILAAPTKVSNAPGATPTCAAQILESLGFGNLRELAAMVTAWRALFELSRASAVVVEHSPTALLAARCFGLPAAVVGDAFCHPPQLIPLPAFAEFASEAQNHEAAAASEGRVVSTINATLDRFGSPPISSLAQLFHEVAIHWRSSWPALYPYATADGIAFRPLCAPQLTPAVNRGGIYARLQPMPGVATVIDWLKSASAPVVLHDETGELWRQYAPFPHHIEVAAQVEVAEAIQHARMAILTAGHHAVAECLAAGVPIVLLPRWLDQVMLATRVMQMGMGLSPPLDRPEQIVADLEAVWRDDFFRVRAAQFVAAQEQNSESHWAALVEGLMALTPRTPHK
jgi:UDP:flavonoid glycosyltransferase YjiC (YdhE family)